MIYFLVGGGSFGGNVGEFPKGRDCFIIASVTTFLNISRRKIPVSWLKRSTFSNTKLIMYRQ